MSIDRNARNKTRALRSFQRTQSDDGIADGVTIVLTPDETLSVNVGDGLTSGGGNLAVKLDGATLSSSGAGLKVNAIDAGQVTSGVFSSARIPNLPESQITNLVTDLAAKEPTLPFSAKGDLLTTPNGSTRAALPVGANGTVLTADSTQTNGVKWAAGGGGSSPLTTKGDVYVFSTVAARLPVGADGQVLQADSTQATGLLWATPASGTPTGLKNKIINGDLHIWQRATTATPVGNSIGVYTADRFKFTSGSTTTVNWSLVRTVSTAGTNPPGPYYLAMSCTLGAGSLAAGDYTALAYVIEAFDLRPIFGQQVTLSFWVQPTTTGTYCVAFQNATQTRSYVAEYTATGGVWQRASVTLTIDSSASAASWLFDTNQQGLRISWALACGSTFQTTAGSWQAGDFRATSNQTNVAITTGRKLWIANIQLEIGSSASALEFRPYYFEKLLCQRYFFSTFPDGTLPAQGATLNGALVYRAFAAGVKTATVCCLLPVLPRATSITTYNPSAASSVWRNATGAANSGFPAAAIQGQTVFIDNPQVAADAIGDQLRIHFSNDCDF